MGRLKRWFKWLVREWLLALLDDDETNDLVVVHPMTGQRMPARALHIAGQMLVCESSKAEDRFCIASHHATDEDRFWRVWRRLGGDRLRWADGSKFDPNAT